MSLRDAARRFPWRDLKYLLWLPAYLLSYLVLERIVDPSRAYWATQTALDSRIPFCEWFIIPYCLWYPLLVAVGLYLLFRDSNSFRRYMRFLAVTFFLSALIWFLVPNGQDLRPLAMPRDNFLTRWVSAIYAVDTNTNVFPSVHVVGSVAAAWAVWECRSLRKHPVLCWGVTLLAGLICISTLFIKQHAVLDVVSGAALALAVGVPVYCWKPVSQRRFWPLRGLK